MIIDLPRSAPAVLDVLEQPGRYLVRDSDLEVELLVLIRIYVSYRSACIECARGWEREAVRTGVEAARLRALANWRNASTSDLFTIRERAAFVWAEALLFASGRDEWAIARLQARVRFSERDLADLSLAVLSALAWSRLAIATGYLPSEAVDAPQRRQTSPPADDVAGTRGAHACLAAASR